MRADQAGNAKVISTPLSGLVLIGKTAPTATSRRSRDATLFSRAAQLENWEARGECGYGRLIVRARITDASPIVDHTASNPRSVAAIAGYIAGPPDEIVTTGAKFTR